MAPNYAPIIAALIELGKELDRNTLLPALCREATDFVQSDPFAFCVATCLDRGMKTEVVWTFPYWLKRELGHLDPWRVSRLPLGELAAAVHRLPKRPRYVNDAPRTIHEISVIVVEEHLGHAERIWQNRSAREVQRTFESVHGVGPGIASMALLLIEKGFGVRFTDLDHRHMDIKPDVHTMRVLHRLKVIDEPTVGKAIAGARFLNPAYPGEIDGALWHIGRTWCAPQSPNCRACYMGTLCPSAP